MISIIAILAAMLLPALGKAREAAYTIKCTGNQKQLLNMHMLYADTYKDWGIGNYYPYYESKSSGKRVEYMRFFRTDDPDFATGIGLPEKSLAKFLECNSADRWIKAGGYAPASLERYAVNSHACSTQAGRNNYAWASVEEGYFKPSTVKLPGRMGWVTDGRDYQDNTWRFWHNGNCVIGFVDMSVCPLRKSRRLTAALHRTFCKVSSISRQTAFSAMFRLLRRLIPVRCSKTRLRPAGRSACRCAARAAA